MDAGAVSQTVSQWDCFLKNLGVWQGSFSHFSPQGDLQNDVPSLLTLENIADQISDQTVRLTLQRFATTGEPIADLVQEYSSLNRSILFFETGAFSQGSIQYGPFSEFGAELAFLAGDRRLRMVQQFDQAGQFAKLTLIREHRSSVSLSPLPDLTPDQLVGTWQGTAVTIFPDWRPAIRYETQLIVEREGDRLHQQLSAPGLEFASTAQIEGTVLQFQQGKYPIQVVLLPGGASSNTPLVIPRSQPFFLEAGWLIQPDLRQRMIRNYDARGGWYSLTLITERKKSG